MLRKLDWIKDCGFFENYRWEAKLPGGGATPPEFARINVIYGPNGSGKTSLARVFDGLRNPPDEEGYRRLSVSVDDGSTRSTDGNDDDFFDRILVFSELYVDRSHNFTAGKPDMPAVLTIGEKPVDAERKLERLREEKAAKVDERKYQQKLQKEADDELKKLHVDVSQLVVAAASNAKGRWVSHGVYHVGVVRKAFAGSHDAWKKLPEEELERLKLRVNSGESEAIPENQLLVAIPDGLSKRLATALETTPTTIMLDTLETRPDAANWVDAGRRLHDGVDTCIFCGSPFSEERRNLIDQHFSDAVQRVQSELGSIRDCLQDILESIETTIAGLPGRGLFFEDLRLRHAEANTEIRSELNALKSWTNAALELVQKKLSNILSPMDFVIEDIPVVSASAMLGLRNKHNIRVRDREKSIQEAAAAIEHHFLKLGEASEKEISTKAAKAKMAGEALDETIAGISAEIDSLETVDGDPMPSAKVLTNEVARLLGRNELEFELVNGRYQVTRDGKPAQHLSLGERNVIALIHFLEQVAKFDSAKGKPIVIIDDPVSSLDSDIFMGVSTYIWAEAISDHVAQLFLLSHNFELFRQWDIQIEALHKNHTFKNAYPTEFYEIRSRHKTQDGTTKRQPVLAKWPPSDQVRKMIRSTYHHAFMSLKDAKGRLEADDSIENRLDAQLLFPNVIRRVLETFLAFKHPEWVGDLNGAMRGSADLLQEAGYEGNADALRLRLLRYAHAYSHSQSPATDSIVSPDEISSVIASVFEFMYYLDPDHYVGLCQVTGYTEASK